MRSSLMSVVIANVSNHALKKRRSHLQKPVISDTQFVHVPLSQKIAFCCQKVATFLQHKRHYCIAIRGELKMINNIGRVKHPVYKTYY
jgi:hypothetical protein